MKKLDQKAFTLIELMVVIAIIGVLVTIVIVAINPVRLINDARDSTRRSDLQQVKASMQLYYNDCKTYPTDAVFDPLLAAGSQMGGTADGVDGVAATTCDNNQTYMRQLPDDPGFVYTRVSTTSYQITADLADPDTEDAATLTKCGVAASGTVEYAVCND